MTTATETTNVRSKILDYFVKDTNRTLTAAQARNFFGIKNVRARISELRAEGYDIRTTMKLNRDGVERGVYSLVAARRGRRS